MNPLDSLFATIAAHWHRWRLPRGIPSWLAERPHLCAYCTYTHWARTKGAWMRVGPHDCVEKVATARTVLR